MSERDWLGYVALMALFACSAFFSAAETALLSSKRVHLQALAEHEHRSARMALKLLEHPGNLLATLLVGNNVVNVAAATLGAVMFGPLKATVIITLAVLFIGEIPPKTMAAHWPERLSLFFAYPVRVMQILLTPLVWLASRFTDLILWPFSKRLGVPSQRFFSREEIKTAIDESQDAGELEPGETRMAQEALDLAKAKIGDLMLPSAEAACLRYEMSRAEVMAELRLRRFSRYPLFKKGVARPVGILHIKDLLLANPEVPWQSLKRSLPFRLATMDAADLLRDMQILRFHMAAVVDEAGSVVGFITLERLIEEIVGEITDEHERESDPIQALDIGTFQVRSDLAVRDVALLLNVDLETDEPDLSIDSYFRKVTGGVSASTLRIGDGMIRPGKNGYLVFLFESRAADNDGHDAWDDEDETAPKRRETT